MLGLLAAAPSMLGALSGGAGGGGGAMSPDQVSSQSGTSTSGGGDFNFGGKGGLESLIPYAAIVLVVVMLARR